MDPSTPPPTPTKPPRCPDAPKKSDHQITSNQAKGLLSFAHDK